MFLYFLVLDPEHSKFVPKDQTYVLRPEGGSCKFHFHTNSETWLTTKGKKTRYANSEQLIGPKVTKIVMKENFEFEVCTHTVKPSICMIFPGRRRRRSRTKSESQF